MSLYPLDYNPDDLMVQVSELLVATSDASDADIDQSVPEVLRLLREKLRMDVVFVSQFVDGQRLFRYVDTAPLHPVISAGGSDPLEDSWCQRVVDGRLPQLIRDTADLPATVEALKNVPFPIGTHISTPIVLRNGEVYGTLCTFSFESRSTAGLDDLKVLQLTAQLTAEKIQQRRMQAAPPPAKRPPQELQLTPMEPSKRF